MTRPILSDAFAHHVWATQRLIDTCIGLTPEQLATFEPGTYGTIIETMRHLVGGDASYLFVLSGGRYPDDGSEAHAPLGIRLAQVVHHGTDHRSQICTALTTLGIEPPLIDAWDFAESEGRFSETPPTA